MLPFPVDPTLGALPDGSGQPLVGGDNLRGRHVEPGPLCAFRAPECLLRVTELEPTLVPGYPRPTVGRVLDGDDPVRPHVTQACCHVGPAPWVRGNEVRGHQERRSGSPSSTRTPFVRREHGSARRRARSRGDRSCRRIGRSGILARCIDVRARASRCWSWLFEGRDEPAGGEAACRPFRVDGGLAFPTPKVLGRAASRHTTALLAARSESVRRGA